VRGQSTLDHFRSLCFSLTLGSLQQQDEQCDHQQNGQRKVDTVRAASRQHDSDDGQLLVSAVLDQAMQASSVARMSSGDELEVTQPQGHAPRAKFTMRSLTEWGQCIPAIWDLKDAVNFLPNCSHRPLEPQVLCPQIAVTILA
jgi:hypothetical protein